MQRGNDTISFNINTTQHLSTVTYFFGFDGFSETKTCNINEAQDRYNKAIKNGYKIT
jgi:hypothetical protein